MFIREALLSDLDAIADCGERFFDYADFKAKGLTLERKSFKAMVARHVEDESGIVLLLMDGLNVKGGICGSISPWGFNNSINVCLESFYWVDAEHRGGSGSMRLFNEYERLLSERGGNASFMVSVDTHLQGKVNHLYKRKGYLPLEQIFVKTF